MLTIVTWYWRQPGRPPYPPGAVTWVRDQVRRAYRAPHRFVCVTNVPAGIARDVEILPDREDWADLPSPTGPLARVVSAYRRLFLFAPEAVAVFGPRVVLLDLDVVLVGDVAPLWDRPDDVVILRDVNPRGRYGAGMILHRTGSRPEVWSRFAGAASARAAAAAGMLGCDQAWIGYVLGPHVPTWGPADGVLSFKAHIGAGRSRPVPPNTRVVMFHGDPRPWAAACAHVPWIDFDPARYDDARRPV